MDGDALSVTGLTADHGAVAATAGGFTTTPDANYNGAISLSYSVSDGHGGTVSASQGFSLRR